MREGRKEGRKDAGKGHKSERGHGRREAEEGST